MEYLISPKLNILTRQVTQRDNLSPSSQIKAQPKMILWFEKYEDALNV